ncbi:hypothetical protein [Serratia quinivorans]|uniref:hypothetical protein n=1 Tax=Serratia quinivorans TaxID=137545 RepID=UPI002E7A811E|nr:hypothetical protein [Serratia quinivorans]
MQHILTRGCLLGTVGLLMLLQAPVQAAEMAAIHPSVTTPAVISMDDAGWHVTVSPYLWMPSLRGNGAVDGHAGRFKAPFHKLVRDLDFVTMGNITVNTGRYGMFFDGQYFDLSEHLDFRSDTVSAHSSVRSTQLNLGGFYQAWRGTLGGSTLFGEQREWVISPAAGVHWTRMRVKMWGEGLSAAHSNTWAVPFIGVRSSYDLSERWSLSGQSDVGAWGRQFNLQAQAYLGYRLGIWGKESLLRVGARILHQDYQDDGFHWNVSQYGPVAGLSMTF